MSLINAKQTAAELCVSQQTIGEWLDQGIITPEIREGRCIRFDLEKVRAQLAKRAKKAKREGYAKHEASNPAGMVPTF